MTRTREQVSVRKANASRDWLGGAIEVILGGLLLLLPAALGGVQPWSETAALGIVGVLVVLALVRSAWIRQKAWVGWRVLGPVVGFVLVAAVQLVALPGGWLGRVSPETARLRADLTADLVGVSGLSRGDTLSFYPYATQHDLRIILLAAGVFFVVLEVYRTPRQIRRLLATIAVIGGASAVLALLQDFAGNEKIYWVIPTAYRATCGSFVNYSNFSQFMNLSIGATLGLLLIYFEEARKADEVDTDEEERGIAVLAKPRYRPVLALAGVILLSAVAIMLSMSRGGMLSLMVAAGITVLLLSRKRAKEGGWVISAILMLVFCVLLYAGFDAVCDRLSTLYNRPDPTSGRSQEFKDMAGIIRKFPAFGIGLGSHEMVYPMFDQSHDANLPQSADSDWFQVFEETGIVGGALVVAFVAGIGSCFVRLVRRSRKGIYLVAYGVGFGLIAVVLHSFTDFGQHVPAVAALSAISCAVIVNLARLRDEERVEKAEAEGREVTIQPPGLVAGLVRRACLLAVAAGLIWATIGSYQTAVAAWHWGHAEDISGELSANNWQGSDEQFRSMLAEASLAAATVPGNANYRFDLNGMRWNAITRQSDQPGNGTLDLSQQQLGFAERIVDDLKVTRTLCPTFAPPCALEGQIEFFVLGQPAGADRIREACRLYPNHSQIAFEGGVVDVDQQRWDESLRQFNHCLDVDPGLFGDIASLYIDQAGRPDLAATLARQRNSVGDILDVISRLAGRPAAAQDEATQRSIAEAADTLIHQRLPEDAPAWQLRALADLCIQRGDVPTGTDYLRRAIAKDYGQVGWHLRLAQLLDQQGKTMDAVDEARICLRLQPGMEEARRMLADLSVRPGFVPDR
jgi:hypothetical protein